MAGPIVRAGSVVFTRILPSTRVLVASRSLPNLAIMAWRGSITARAASLSLETVSLGSRLSVRVASRMSVATSVALGASGVGTAAGVTWVSVAKFVLANAVAFGVGEAAGMLIMWAIKCVKESGAPNGVGYASQCLSEIDRGGILCCVRRDVACFATDFRSAAYMVSSGQLCMTVQGVKELTRIVMDLDTFGRVDCPFEIGVCVSLNGYEQVVSECGPGFEPLMACAELDLLYGSGFGVPMDRRKVSWCSDMMRFNGAVRLHTVFDDLEIQVNASYFVNVFVRMLQVTTEKFMYSLTLRAECI